MKVKAYFEIFPGQTDNILMSSYPLTHKLSPGWKRYVATIEVPDNDGTDAIPVPHNDISVEEVN